MSTIIAGRFDNIEQARAAIQSLEQEGFRQGEYAAYYVPPPGQHALFPIGGDAYNDEGTRDAGRGAATGAVVGGATGLAIGAAAGGPPGALAGAGVGAYVGALAGALKKTRGGNEEHATADQPVERSGGQMIAVCVDRPGTEDNAIAVLDRHGAHEIERAEGEWRDGGWQNFDPRAPTDTVRSAVERDGQA